MGFRLSTLLLLLAGTLAANAQAPARIGIAAPLSGPSAMLGAQVAEGVRQAAGDAAVSVADTVCTAEGGRRAAAELAAAKVEAVVGFLCTESLEAALPVLRAAGIPAMNVGVRADRFTAERRKTGNLVWRIAPPAEAEARAVTALVASRWRETPFGILDDGSVQNRALADAVRDRVEAAGLRAATIDTFRPAEEKQFALARRLARTGVTHFVFAGERPDAAIVARDAKESGLALELIGGEALVDEPPDGGDLPAGTLAVAPQDRFAGVGRPGHAEDMAQRGYFGPAFAGTQIALAAIGRARDGGRSVAEVLNAEAFPTALGTVRFDAAGDSDLDLFRVHRFDGSDFVPESGG